jgi:hypothetical protein
VHTATAVRNLNGKLSVTDGPFAETKEILGGFTIIDARDLNEAIHLVSKFPAALIGSAEVRPALEPGVGPNGSIGGLPPSTAGRATRSCGKSASRGFLILP